MGRLESVGVSGTELWPAIFEKAIVKRFTDPRRLYCDEAYAYARYKRRRAGLPLNGASFMDLHGGFPRWAIQIIFGLSDFPGLRLHTRALSLADVEYLFDPPGSRSVICLCSDTCHTDAVREDGFVYGHAYGVLKTARRDGELLIRVYNPWGVYEPLDVDERIIDGASANDGAFYITYDTMLKRFPFLSVVFLAK